MLFSPFFTKTCHVHGISGNICYERNIIWILALKIAHVKYFKTLPLFKIIFRHIAPPKALIGQNALNIG
jgi:hypothetical protein